MAQRSVPQSEYRVVGTRNAGCQLCVLHEGVQNICVPTVIMEKSRSPTPLTPAVICIGQNPGQQEDAACLPFVGPSGVLLVEGMVKAARIHELATVYITNATRCATEKNANPPFAKCARPCFGAYTAADLAAIAATHTSAPIIILCVGAPAAGVVYRELFGFKKAPSQSECFALNGKSHKPTAFVGPSITVFSSYHPAYLFRNPNVNTEMEAHMGQLQRFLVGDVPVVASPSIVEPHAPWSP